MHITYQFGVILYPWNKIVNTPVFNGNPPHVLVVEDMKVIKQKLVYQTGDIVAGLKYKLYMNHIRYDTYQASTILNQVYKERDGMLTTPMST